MEDGFLLETKWSSSLGVGRKARPVDSLRSGRCPVLGRKLLET